MIIITLFKSLKALFIEPITHYSFIPHSYLVVLSDMWRTHSCPVGSRLTEAWQPICAKQPLRPPPKSTHIHTRQSGLSVLPKDTWTDSDGAGFEPQTLRLLDNQLPYLPSHSRPVINWFCSYSFGCTYTM